MARIISERRVLEEVSHEDELDHDQECKLGNGVMEYGYKINQVPDKNPDWFKHDNKGKVLHLRVNPM